ncbi:hypothetical protein WMY93_020097 [Mugilogobius chulae]|uniref:Uncharacterized protein n=1 Tax=Mugilogobius chulae TaxID=88201 RepID=A0AAW0NLY6_9GOBI
MTTLHTVSRVRAHLLAFTNAVNAVKTTRQASIDAERRGLAFLCPAPNSTRENIFNHKPPQTARIKADRLDGGRIVPLFPVKKGEGQKSQGPLQLRSPFYYKHHFGICSLTQILRRLTFQSSDPFQKKCNYCSVCVELILDHHGEHWNATDQLHVRGHRLDHGHRGHGFTAVESLRLHWPQPAHLEIKWEGIWMNCVYQTTGHMQCKTYDSMLALPPDIQAARALMCIAIFMGWLSCTVSCCGMKCTTCAGDDRRAKAGIALSGGFCSFSPGCACSCRCRGRLTLWCRISTTQTSRSCTSASWARPFIWVGLLL